MYCISHRFEWILSLGGVMYFYILFNCLLYKTSPFWIIRFWYDHPITIRHAGKIQCYRQLKGAKPRPQGNKRPGFSDSLPTKQKLVCQLPFWCIYSWIFFLYFESSFRYLSQGFLIAPTMRKTTFVIQNYVNASLNSSRDVN